MQNEIYQEYLEECKQEQVPVVLTAAEAMDILGVGKNTMYRLLNTGKIKGVRIGRSWRVTLPEIESFLTNISGNIKMN
jgi:excisionase family DNA binding protein